MDANHVTRDIRQALTRAGLCPAGSAVGNLSKHARPGQDLLPPIINSWVQPGRCDDQGGDAESRARAARLAALQRLRQAGGQMTWGVPGGACHVASDWLGQRLAWWPRGVLSGRRVGLISSRLGRNMDRHKPWFAALRTACIRLDPTRDVLLTSDSIALHRFVQRCGRLFGIPTLCVQVACEEPWEEWTPSLLAVDADADATDAPHRVSLSPPIPSDDGPRTTELAQSPLADRAVMALGDLLIVLHIRPGGNVYRLLEARLNSSAFPAASVFLALGDDFVPRTIAEPLMDRGAVGWYVVERTGQTRQHGPTPWFAAGIATAAAAPIVDCPSSEGWHYLTHCTRRRQGPWPGQTEDGYLDDLILDRRGADHSAFAALWRIVRNRKLLASSELIRGDTPVVSLTEVALDQIHRLHTFRSHLGRWDFEPYGICVCRQWLQQRGARPVCYGDDSLWESLSVEDRPFFQRSQSQTGKGNVFDWTIEREWRLCGDLSLKDVPRDAAMVFVPTRREACQLAGASPWPVAVLPSSHRPETRREQQ